jgi:mitochondrial fission protein ELM1|tara:strand:+ start:47 stop:994 length:948 start_codon:yes stop_codon:yes gene_type:complete
MAKPKAILLTEGKHGMISQVEGMAQALQAEYSHKIVRLRFPWNFVPPKFTPISQIILKDKIYLSENVSSNFIISCGRKSVIPSILLKKKYPKVFSIHIQDPKVNLKNFDIIVAPEHDNLSGSNILNSKGAIHYITDSEINNAKSYLKNKIDSEKIVSLILGGPNKYYNFNTDQLVKIFNEVRSNFINKGFKVIVIPSMRTPKLIIDLAINEFKNDGHVLGSVDKQAYLSALALGTYIVVTSDSTSMISEAAASGKPIFVAHMKSKKNNYRFKKFYQLFREMGIIRDLGDNIESWKYNRLNEAERIAKEINIKIEN